MPVFCDVALPVPLERLFTYQVNGTVPVVGARVLVPFSGQRLTGVVIRVHDQAPEPGIEIRPVQQVLDDAALLPDDLMQLAEWVALYYIAPLGEVLRSMLPLGAELKRTVLYQIAEAGRRVLYEGAAKGASRRSRLTPEQQAREYAVLNHLEGGEPAKSSVLRSSTGANKALLEGHGAEALADAPGGGRGPGCAAAAQDRRAGRGTRGCQSSTRTRWPSSPS